MHNEYALLAKPGLLIIIFIFIIIIFIFMLGIESWIFKITYKHHLGLAVIAIIVGYMEGVPIGISLIIVLILTVLIALTQKAIDLLINRESVKKFLFDNKPMESVKKLLFGNKPLE